MHSIRCWAKRHNATFVLSSVSRDELKLGYSRPYGPGRQWQGVSFDKINDVRHRVVSRVLEKFGHVLHIDTDTIALNERRSLRPFTRHAAALQFQIRENGEVAASTYLARRSDEAFCFLQLWREMGEQTHRNPRPMLNTDNGVLVMLVGRLLDEPTAVACETAAVLGSRGERASSSNAALPLWPPWSHGSLLQRGNRAYTESFLPCFVERFTTTLLLHRLQRSSVLPWLRFLFPREGWQRSFELHDGKQHDSLTSLQPSSDIFGHGWKAMGRALVRPETCTPQLDVANVSGGKLLILTPHNESALAVSMCWWLHKAFGGEAYRACSTPRITTRLDGRSDPRVLLKFNRIGYGTAGKFVVHTQTLNISERDANDLFVSQTTTTTTTRSARRSSSSSGSSSSRWKLAAAPEARSGGARGRGGRAYRGAVATT